MKEGRGCRESSHSQVSGPETRTSHIGVDPRLPIHSTAELCHETCINRIPSDPSPFVIGDGMCPHLPKRRSLYAWKTALAAWGYRLMIAERWAYLA
jgi:hypothetical protein